MMPLQAQQLSRSYNGRLLVNLEITVRDSASEPNQLYNAEINDLCIGEIPAHPAVPAMRTVG